MKTNEELSKLLRDAGVPVGYRISFFDERGMWKTMVEIQPRTKRERFEEWLRTLDTPDDGLYYVNKLMFNEMGLWAMYDALMPETDE